MSRWTQFALAVLLLLTCSLAGLARKESLEELKVKLSSAKLSDQPKICVQIARQQLEAMEKTYQEGQTAQAQKLLQEVVNYSQQAGDAARKSGKHIKNTEIELRRISRRLQDLKPTLDVDSRPPVQDAINRLEHIRTQLLMQMFSKD